MASDFFQVIKDKKKNGNSSNLFDFYLVGTTGFEPATFCSQSRRDTKLRYVPKWRAPQESNS
jgi:hypothetical protein